MNLQGVRQILREQAFGNDEYAFFNKKIVMTNKKVLGVRTPQMRKLAKSWAKEVDAKSVRKLAREINPDVFEEVFLLGLVIGEAKISDEEKQKLIFDYLKLVDSWALVDCVIGKKLPAKNFDEKLWWQFAQKCLELGGEFEVRAGVIAQMQYFLTDKNLAKVFVSLRKIKTDKYYVKMATAWLYATAAAFYFEETMAELEKGKIDEWVVKKSYQKMKESFRISDKQKAIINKRVAK